MKFSILQTRFILRIQWINTRSPVESQHRNDVIFLIIRWHILSLPISLILVTWPTATGWGTTSRAGSRSRTTPCPQPPGWTPGAAWSSLRGSSGPSRPRWPGPSSTSCPTTSSPSPPIETSGSSPLTRGEWPGALRMTRCTMLMGLPSTITLKNNQFI